MGYFNIDFNQFRPSSATKTPTPTGASPTLQPTLLPQPQTLQPSVQPTEPTQDEGIMQKIFNALSWPSQKTEELLTGGQGYEKQLENPAVRNAVSTIMSLPLAGLNKGNIQKGLETPEGRGLTGFTGRMILDPLNLVGVGAAKLVGKIPGVSKIVSKVGSVVPKAAELIKKIPIPSLVKEDRMIKPAMTTVGNIVENFGQKFIKGYGLPETYNLAKSEIPTKVSMGVKEIIERTKRQFAGLGNDVIEAIPKFLEPNSKITKVGDIIPGAGTGTNLGELRKELGEETWKKVQPVLHEIRQQFDADIVDLVKRGRMKGEEAKRLLTQGGYYPHTDFVPAKLKEFFIKPKLGEKRAYTEARKGVAGFTYNAPKAIARREFMQYQDNVLQDFFKEVKDKFGVKIGEGNPVPEGFVPFLNESPRVQELRGWALPKRIAEDINTSLSTGGELGKVIDTFNLLWKPTATAMNPAFHFMNVMGNMYNSWLGGVKDPRRFIQMLDPRAIYKGLASFTAEEKAILERTGVLSRGQFAGDVIKRTFDNPEGLDTLKIFDKFRKVGENFENNARAAFFLDQRNKFIAKGLSDAEATRQALSKVNQYLFDYLTGLTPFEGNVMRRAFPFYTWARFNVPLQFKSLITMPEKNAFVSKIVRELNKEGKPEGDQPGLTFSTPFKDSQGNPIRYKPNLPMQDIFDILSKPMSMLSPLIKEGFELTKYAGSTLAGKPVAPIDLFTGQPRTNVNLPLGEQIKDIVGSEAKSLLRPVRSTSKMFEESFSPGSIVRQLIGGTYTIPSEMIEMQKGGKRQQINKAIMEKVGKIKRDRTLTIEQKRRKVEELLRMRQ